jgi:copper(I)-binding protein
LFACSSVGTRRGCGKRRDMRATSRAARQPNRNGARQRITRSTNILKEQKMRMPLSVTSSVTSALLAALSLTLALGSPVQAHAFLDHSTPAVGSTVQTAPPMLTLWFTQNLEPAFSTVEVTGPNGEQIEQGKPQISGDTMRAAIKSAGAGTYQVHWHVVSVDTHKTKGNFTFRVGGSTAGVSIEKPWMRFVIKSVPAAGYFTLKNDSGSAVQLTAAASSACGMVMLHQSKDVNGVEEMLPVKSVTVGAHGTLSFTPGGYHLMCMSPGSAMKVGATVPVTLKFGNGQSLTAQFPVKGASAQ